MVLYFSGTGNSRWLAEELARLQGDTAVDIAALQKAGHAPAAPATAGEALGFVFPVYAWAPPPYVTDFIAAHDWAAWQGHYAYTLCGCGDEAGDTIALLQKAAARAGIRIVSGWALRMPNNYIITYDTDPPEMEQRKLRVAQNQLPRIAAALAQRKEGAFHRARGKSPGLHSRVVSPLFNRMMRSTRPFAATENCNSCGLCARICPVQMIELDAETHRPHWQKGNCAMCMGCISRCPQRSIEYKDKTQNKGRYYNPLCGAGRREETTQ